MRYEPIRGENKRGKGGEGLSFPFRLPLFSIGDGRCRAADDENKNQEDFILLASITNYAFLLRSLGCRFVLQKFKRLLHLNVFNIRLSWCLR